MYKATVVLTVLSLTAFAGHQTAPRPTLALKEEAISLEYTVSAGEGTIIVQAESEVGIGSVEVRTPSGAPVLRIDARNQANLSVSGFVIESRESRTADLAQTYEEGRYTLRAWTPDGRPLLGAADFSHALLPAPTVLHPLEGQFVPADRVYVRWIDDAEAESYRVVVEQGNNDTMTVTLPAGSSYFEVPRGVLRPGELSHVEVGAFGSNGNCTIVEVEFTTL